MGFYPFTANQTVGGNLTVTGSSTTGTLAVTGAGTVGGSFTVTGNLLTNSVPWIPSDNGFLATTDDMTINGTGAMVAGTVYLRKIFARTAITVTNIWAQVSVAGVGASTGTFVGLYSSAGTLLSGSADQATPLSTLGAQSMPLTTPQALAAGSFAWIAVVVNLATSQPTLRASSATPIVQNTNLAAASLSAAVNGTVLTALPASITPASNTPSGAFPFWFAVS